MDDITDKMRDEWNTRAATKESAIYAITDRYEGPEEPFYDLGRVHVGDMLLALSAHGIYIQRGDVAVEVGAGIGRMSIWLSDIVKQLYATDISSAMLEKAPARNNVTYISTGTLTDVPAPVDWVLSHLVFQHMPKLHFWKYLREAHDLLKVGGIFHTQMHETDTPEERDDSTILVRGYTREELRAGIDESQWEVINLLDPYGMSEVWKWLTLRKR